MAAETMRELARLGISSSTVWRHHKEVTEQVAEELDREEQKVPIWVLWQDAEAMDWIAAQDPVMNHASVSIDGVRVLIRDGGYKEVKMVSVSEVEKQTEKQGKPVTPNEAKDTRGRQDSIKLTQHSYRAILGDKPTFIPALRAELARRGVKHVDKITTVNDGADWIWDLVQLYLPEWKVEVLDWPHAVAHLVKAGHAAWGEGTAKFIAWLERRKTEMWEGRVAEMRTALVELPRRYKERGRDIRQVREYMAKHSERLVYDRFRSEERPIGSGTVESAARNVVAWRMKRGGQRWSETGAVRMLAALGEVHSNRWHMWGYQRKQQSTERKHLMFTKARNRRTGARSGYRAVA